MQKLPPQPVQLIDLVHYEAGSVASRTLVNEKAGTVTLFAFDEGEGLAPFDAMVHVLEGKAEVTVSGKPLRLGQGEMVIMPANEPHL